MEEFEYYEVECFNCGCVIGGTDVAPTGPAFCRTCEAVGGDCVSCPDKQKCWDSPDSPCLRDVEV